MNRLPGLANSEKLLATDANMGYETALDKAGQLPAALFGLLSAQSAYQPLLFSVDAFNNVSIGGVNQRCVLLGRVCDEIGPQSFFILPNASGSARIDHIYGAPAEVPTNAQPRDVKMANGVVTTASIPQLAQGAEWRYVKQGDTAPAGFVPVLQITVPASSSIGGVTAADVAMLLELPSQALTVPFINLDAYPGRDRTGVADNSAILQQAYADAASSGVNLIWFSGALLASTTVVPVANVALLGSGLAGSAILQGTASNDIFAATGVNNLEFRGFTMIAHASPSASHPFNLTSTVGLIIQDVTWTGFFNPASFVTCQNFSWRNVQGTAGTSGGVLFNGFILGNFFDCDFSNNGGHGVQCTGGNNSGAGWIMKWYGGRAVQNNQNALGASGFYINVNLTGFEFFGFGFGNIAQANPAVNPQLYGLALAGGNDYVRAFGCGMVGNVTAPLQGTLGVHCVIKDCPGYNPVGALNSGASPSFPSSGSPLQNPFGADATVYLNVGSATISTVQVGGVTLYSSPAVSSVLPIRLPVGMSIVVNFSSGPPTWDWVVE